MDAISLDECISKFDALIRRVHQLPERDQIKFIEHVSKCCEKPNEGKGSKESS